MITLDPTEFTANRVGFPGESLDPPQVDLPAIVQCQRRGQRRRQGNANMQSMNE